MVEFIVHALGLCPDHMAHLDLKEVLFLLWFLVTTGAISFYRKKIVEIFFKKNTDLNIRS